MAKSLGIKVPRKKTVIRRPKTGIAAIPTDGSFAQCKWYCHYDLDRKDILTIVKGYVKKHFTKDEAAAINAQPDYALSMYTHYAAAIAWEETGKEFEERYASYKGAAKKYLETLIESGKLLLAQKKAKEAATAHVVKLTPQELIFNKVQATVMTDLDDLEDQWIEGQKTEFDMYNCFKRHDLKSVATPYVRKRLEGWLLDYEDAYHKRCDQAVEGYSHLTRAELKRRITVINSMMSDLDKFKAAAKAVRAPRVPKARAADKQIASLKYLKESSEFKLRSINPIQLPGSMRLYTFNVKNKMLTEYVTQAVAGFEIKGTTLQNVDFEQSRTVKLRKPDDILPMILSKTVKQIDNEWSKLTTKTSVPNGRLGIETILLRVLDR